MTASQLKMVCDLRLREYREYEEPQSEKIQIVALPVDSFFGYPAIAKAYQACWQANFHSEWKHFYVIRNAILAVAAQVQSEYFGFGLITLHHGSDPPQWVDEVMRFPDYRGQGLGQLIMQRLIFEAKRVGIQRLALECDPVKDKGYLPKFYAKFGFTPVP